MALLLAKNISKSYEDGTVALDRASISVSKGEFVAIMGPSGSGKSTLLHILGLLDPATVGEYRFADVLVSDLSGAEIASLRNGKIGFVFQSFNLLPRTSVYENVLLPLVYSQVPEEDWGAKVRAAIDAVGLSHRIEHMTSLLSGGERQRVAIARALVVSPEIIFADEPTGNLDSKSGTQVMDIFKKLNSEGKTVVLITHDEKIASFGKRLVKIRDGRIESDIVQKTS
ncbi:MAG TPA: ABC transporter ATP-binding protein [Candidatus Paceibacterota bacterium]